MNKLNRRGYLTIEIILAGVMTFVIAFFLIDLTMSLTDITDNTYEDTTLVTDKALVIKNIKENIENDMCSNGGISNVICIGNSCTINMNVNNVVRKITIDPDSKTLNYTDGVGTVIYTKELQESFSNISINSTNSNGYYNFKITGKNIFIDKSYNINIIVYNKTSC